MSQKQGRSLNVQPARQKLNELFITWLTLSDTQDLLNGIIGQTEGKEPNIGGKISTSQKAALKGALPAPLEGFLPSSQVRGTDGHVASSEIPSPSNIQKLKVVDEWERMRPKMTSPPSSPKPGYGPGHMAPPAPLSPHGHRTHLHPLEAVGSHGSSGYLSPTRASPTRNRGPMSPPRERPATASLIPRFWFPEPGAPTKDDIERESKAIAVAFKFTPKGKPAKSAKPVLRSFKLQSPPQIAEWVEFVTQVLGFPGWWSTQLFHRLTKPGGEVTHKVLKDWWDKDMAHLTKQRRLFNFLKNSPNRDYLIASDFEPFVQDLLLVHPGLEFLKQTPEFQEKYAETVVVRIFYTVNRGGNGKISFKEYSRSRLHDVMLLLDAEEDINNVTEFFSYEHFYVLYCKFWELDGDHDFYIAKEDLMKYNNYSLTEPVIDAVFNGVPRPLSSDKPGQISYEDFIWFCLSEEDKTSETSLTYWFRCLDLDKDGIISGFELDHYFVEQRKRMETYLTEQIQYDDILCQMIDMIKPRDPKNIRLSDMKACPTSGIFFNALFNLNKFIAFEQRDPFQAHAEKQGSAEKTDWDRFARAEYDRMAMEAEHSEEYGEGGE